MGKQQTKDDFTLAMWMEFLSMKQEHYPISDEFVKKYQQAPNNMKGYMYYAWKTKHVICQVLAEPNQKWHFFESYILRELIKTSGRSVCLTDPAESVYRRIKCPELLLWIAEATGVSQNEICVAAEKAKRIIDREDSRVARNLAGFELRNKITWEKLETEMKKQIEEEETRKAEK